MYELNLEMEQDTRHLVDAFSLIDEYELTVHSIEVNGGDYTCSEMVGKTCYVITLMVDVTACEDDKYILLALDKIEQRSARLTGFIRAQSRITS